MKVKYIQIWKYFKNTYISKFPIIGIFPEIPDKFQTTYIFEIIF